jgi:c-di-GMP-binding flagellar brake protein YcgR
MASAQTVEAPAQDIEFDNLNLQVGGRLQFITHRGIKPVQHFSTLVGYVKDEYLIVKVPLDGGAPIPLNDGEKLTIRVFTGVTVCSFSCSVHRVFARPLNYVHLSFPDQIQGANLRAAMRVKVDIPAQLTGSSAFATCNVFIVNLSVSGALIESPRPLSPSDKFVNLAFTLIAQPGNVQVLVTSKVAIQNINVIKANPEGPEVHTYGVRFIDLAQAHYTLLQNITYEALIADRQKIV